MKKRADNVEGQGSDVPANGQGGMTDSMGINF